MPFRLVTGRHYWWQVVIPRGLLLSKSLVRAREKLVSHPGWPGTTEPGLQDDYNKAMSEFKEMFAGDEHHVAKLVVEICGDLLT